jgi:hypothetical protein
MGEPFGQVLPLMTKPALRFYHRYNEDGSCRVICLDCYATLGTASDRDKVTQMEAVHRCGEWQEAQERIAGESVTIPAREEGLAYLSNLSGPERMLARLHPVLLAGLLALLLYGVPTALEIAARSHVNTWLAVIVPGDVAGCLVLGWLAKMPRTAAALYLLLTACEGCWHLARMTHGVAMAWFADLIPAVVVMCVMVVRGQRARGSGAFV